MYESHFGLSGSPFQLNPDPAFYFDSRGHSNALAYLKFGAHQGEGFIVVTGEIGAGKTTLVRTLLEGLNPDQVVAAQVVSTQLESGELLQAILMSFGIASSSNSKAHLIGSLEAFLTSLAAKGRRALLIIDEAQNLKHEAVEELRMLSNFQLGKYGLLQSFLVGQPELRQLLQSKSMEQLRQRVIASCHLGPLVLPETRAYIEHRLRLVGWANRPEFVPDAFDRIHHWTGGVPRKINRLCNRLLLGAFLANEEKITVALVDRTASELRSEIGELSELTEIPAAPAPAPAQPKRDDRLSGDTGQSVRQQDPPAAVALPAPAVEPVTAALAAGAVGPVAQETRPKVRLVPGATASTAAATAEPLTPTAAVVSRSSTAPVAVPIPHEALENSVPNRSDVRTPLTVVPARRVVAEPSGPPAAVPIPQADNAGADRPHIRRRTYRDGELHRPLICLVESASDFLKAGTLAEVFLKFPALPPLIAVRPGDESSLSFGDTGANELPMPAVGLHLEGLTSGFAPQTHQVLRAFEEILSEFNPTAVLAMGSGNAVLACSLLANKSGVPLVRIGAGVRLHTGEADSLVNGALIDRISDTLFVNRMDSYYTLYHEGIKSDRVLCAGNLVGDMLKRTLPHAPSPGEIFTSAGIQPASPESFEDFALVTINPYREFPSTESRAELFSLLSALCVDLPVIWPVSDETLGALQAEGIAAQLEAAKVVLLAGQGYLQLVGLMEKAKCHVVGTDGTMLEESASLRIPFARLRRDGPGQNMLVETALSAEGTNTHTAAKAIDILRQHLRTCSPASDPPAYWDSGTATRIASHLANWLPNADRSTHTSV